ncbi:MAG: sulfatase-like hydrolase/transferase [Candidatus Aminicenantes bacterium]|nr:sulfatase-like hydrolase/transferase [Candidatus Aminicenantes bacterium]
MKRPPVLHPFLFALFPILALYSHNVKSIPIPLRELAGPLLVSLGCAAVLFAALSAITRDPAKGGAGASLIVVWFLSFGHLAARMTDWTGVPAGRSLFLATALIVGLGTVLIGRSRRAFGGLTWLLNAVSAALVLFNIASTAQTFARRPQLGPGAEVRVARPTTARPNIYYIVLDAYTRADILKDVYAFDNSPFLSALEARGFTVAGRSYANYNLTHQSLASSLNFTLLDALAEDAGYASSDREPLYSMIRANRAMAFLKDEGYRLITVSSSIGPTDFRSVDRYFGFAASDSEFRTVFLQTTPLRLLVRPGETAASYDAHRRRVLNAFRALEESAHEKGPFFMFVHIMAPHPPFVFGPGGEPIEPDYLFSMVDADRLHGGSEKARSDYIARYRDQLSYLNREIMAAVDAVLSGSAEPPVIVIQGDHGSRAYTDFDRPEASYFKENLAILNAYHLPGLGGESVYPGISPVNTFRLIFRHYFGAELELLPDASAWTTWRRPYRFLPFDEASYRPTAESVRRATKPKSPIVQKR